MKKETKSSMKSDVATGLSSAVGATIGMIVGNAASAKVNAMVAPAPEPAPTPVPAKPESAQQEPVKPEPNKPEPIKPEPPQLEPVKPEPEVEVLGYETVMHDSGNLMDVAVVRVDGQEIAFIDGNMDGVADVYIMDVNHNGTLEEEECIPIKDVRLDMTPLREAAQMEASLVAQEADYVNDADVNDFMA